MWESDEFEVGTEGLVRPAVRSNDPLSAALRRMQEQDREELSKLIGPAIRRVNKGDRSKSDIKAKG